MGLFIWTKLNPHQRMHCVKFGWNWPNGFGEEDFKYCQYIFTRSLLSPLGKCMALSCHTQKSPHLRIPCVDIGSVVLEKTQRYERYLQQQRRQTTDIFRSQKLTWALSSGELKTYIRVKGCYAFYITRLHHLIRSQKIRVLLSRKLKLS